MPKINYSQRKPCLCIVHKTDGKEKILVNNNRKKNPPTIPADKASGYPTTRPPRVSISVNKQVHTCSRTYVS